MIGLVKSNSPGDGESPWQRALALFGLTRSRGSRSLSFRRSRYGRAVSPRLDEDVEDLRRRIAALEGRQDR